MRMPSATVICSDVLERTGWSVVLIVLFLRLPTHERCRRDDRDNRDNVHSIPEAPIIQRVVTRFVTPGERGQGIIAHKIGYAHRVEEAVSANVQKLC
jgi:hypothetical protein